MPFSIAGPASPALPSLDGINRATERISSGIRTDFQDQAAEAAIAGRLDTQIGESTIGIRNAISQSSALQQADQTLGQGKDLSERIQELAVQSNSSVLSDSDQSAIQQEAEGLINDLDRLIEQAQFNGEPLFGDNTVNVENLQDQIRQLSDGDSIDQDALSELQEELTGLQADVGAQLNGIERGINQQLDAQINLESSRSDLADTDFATEIAELIKEQFLFEASVKAFDHQRVAEESIIQLLN